MLDLIAMVFGFVLIASSIVGVSRNFIIAYLLASPFAVYTLYVYGTAMPFLVVVIAIICGRLLYSKWFFVFTLFLLIVGFVMFLLHVSGLIWELFDFALGLGTAIALLSDRVALEYVSRNDHSRGSSTDNEINRDLVQIAGGMIMLLILLGVGIGRGRVAITLLVVPLYIVGNYFSLFPGSSLGKILTSLERPTSPLGIGAIWFAAGTMIAFGLVKSVDIMAIIIFVTTIGDSLATIFGSTLHSPKIPYNRKKSLAGFAAIFISSALFAFILLGVTGLGLGLLAAVLESLSIPPLDDNLILPVGLGIVGYFV